MLIDHFMLVTLLEYIYQETYMLVFFVSWGMMWWHSVEPMTMVWE